MDRETAVAHALSKPGAWADNPWGEDHDVVKVSDKIFLFPSAKDGKAAVTIKNTAEAIEELKQRYPEYTGPAPYLNKRLWAQLIIHDVPEAEVFELIDDSYDLVVAGLTKAKRPS